MTAVALDAASLLISIEKLVKFEGNTDTKSTTVTIEQEKNTDCYRPVRHPLHGPVA